MNATPYTRREEKFFAAYTRAERLAARQGWSRDRLQARLAELTSEFLSDMNPKRGGGAS